MIRTAHGARQLIRTLPSFRRERLLAHGRLRHLHLRGARLRLSTGPMRYVDMLLMHKEIKTMRNRMVQTMAAKRYRRSAASKSRLAMVLMISLNVVLLENVLLNVVSVVQNKNFKQQRFIQSLSRCRPA